MKLVGGLLMRSNLKKQPSKLATFNNPQHEQYKKWYTKTFMPSIDKKVNVISREIIKPFSPTPNHNKIVYLSLLDQISPSIFASILLFYRNNHNDNSNNNKKPTVNVTEQKTKLLKQSLSEILVDFFPLAGRIKENELIECNNEGAEFCEAYCDEDLEKYIENPSLKDLHVMLPFLHRSPRHDNIVTSVQVNHFSCGGVVIGICISHKIADAAGIATFAKAWATKTRDSNYSVPDLKFNGASIFPPLKEFNRNVIDHNFGEERLALRRLIFDKKTINALKGNSKTAISPTTVEAITAFIWNRVPKVSGVLHFVHLRPRMVPPIPEGSFGNFTYFTKTARLNTIRTSELMIKELRKAIKKVNDNYIRELFFSENVMLKLKNETNELYDDFQNSLFFSSASGFPIDEVDFGMGKPIWAFYTNYVGNKNSVLIMKTMCGDGIEAWICMLEDDIAILDESLSQLDYPLVKPIAMK